MSDDIGRILSLAGLGFKTVAEDESNEKKVCRDCGDEMGHPTTDCENDAHDKNGDHWIDIDVDGDGDADIKVSADMAEAEVEEAVGDSADPLYDLVDDVANNLADELSSHKLVLDELVRYLSVDQIEEFVADFRRHHDLPMDMDDDLDEAKGSDKDESDEEREKAMKRAFAKSDEPERGEKRKKVSVAKAPWESLEEDDLDENAFNQAAAAAARAGKDTFEFGGKTHKTTMKKDTAHQLDDDIQFESEELEESSCGCCGNDPCDCASDCGCKTESVNEAPTMDTTQLITLLKNSGFTSEAIEEKLTEWANTPEGVGEIDPTDHGEAYEMAQSVNLSLKRYLDAQDMKVQVSESHTPEALTAAYNAKK